ncbi:transcription/translation regulatory transformer protein RfaH [Shewanella sp. GutCb]|uniref:transcription/translation regulatory transformer protein RfaH n=1 Tax=Shewanella sp. GutCb TaxID=2058315 RepID=UPI000C7ACC35|nr:transcription/translation regulatory transformer protein RfaH [Shewanella sp. GutCb]PKG75938.1 transcription/translation regulatory transformer protein RfaH [Shewanella sp. GutCb]
MKAWYLLYCKPRGEVRAQQNLALQEIETYIPTFPEEKLHKGIATVRRVSMFPSYLFVHFDPQITSVARIHSTRGVIRIVGCKELMTSVSDDVIKAIRLREHKWLTELLPYSSNNEAQAPDIQCGDKVKFIDGPFEELEGIFEEKNGEKRCFVLFDIMGKRQRVAVDRTAVKRAGQFEAGVSHK